MTDARVRAALRTIAADSLGAGCRSAGSYDLQNDDRPPDDDALLAGVSRERLTGLAIAAARSGAIVLSSAALDEMHARHEDQLALDLRLERVLVEMSAVLDEASIAYRALKGPLLAHTVYPDPALRSFGDIDLLVPGYAFDAAIAVLRPFGFERRFIEPRAGFDARFSKGACLRQGDGTEFDLHRTLAPGAFGIMLERSDLFSRPPCVFELGAQLVAGLDREMAFVHACFHAALGDHPPRLVPLRDVVQLLTAGIDDAVVIELARSTRCESVFRRAVELVDAELGVHLTGPLPQWARAYRPSRFDRWALQSYAIEHRSYAGQVATSLWALPSARERIAYGAALVFPARDYVRARGYGRRFARGLRVVKDSRPR